MTVFDHQESSGNERFKWSLAFMVAFENMKEFAQKTSMPDMGVSSGWNNAVSYTVDICRDLRCTEKYEKC